MAELAVLNIAKSLLELLSSPAKDELLLWYNSKNELEKLKNTITSINGVLRDAEQKKATNTNIGGWLSRLQDEMYKADDLFDTISTKALRKKVISGNRFKTEIMLFFSKSNPVAFAVKTAHKVKELREQLDDIAKDISQFGLIRSPMEYDQRNAIKRKAEHCYIAEDEVIGREKDKKELLKLLADSDVKERVSVIAVVGIGGQGKTALAQLLYNAKEIEELFEVRLWACINDFSDLKEALEEITDTKSQSLNKLQNMLRAQINGKRFFLVIDDVWDDIREHWQRLKPLLNAGERGSKVLITTRSQMVAQNLVTVKSHYALEELSDEDAWILFKKMAFDSNEGEEDQTKEELGTQIIKKCSKVPLAIRTIGSYLYGKDKKQWSKFVDNELMKAIPNPENIVMQVLKISYDDLPLSLKHCFVYCSLFPKDQKLDKTTLIHLWMAQGLLEISNENPCLEEVGESYFLYLVQRGFFQNLKVDDDGEIISCKMHDLFLDLAIQIAANECQAMLKVTDESGRKFSRHLLVKEIKESLFPCKGLRSLLSPNTGFVEQVLLDGVLLNLTRLRTLSLRQLDVEEIPSSIGKLVHLRYLDLMNSKRLTMLPNAICKLQNLLILRLEGCRNLIKLPDDLQKLISLRYLKIAGCERLKHIPSGLEELTSLVTFDKLVVDNDHGGLRCLKNLNNLTGDIHIQLPYDGWKNCVLDAADSMLTCKTKLCRLSLRWVKEINREKFREADEVRDVLLEADEVLDSLQPSKNISLLKVLCFPGTKFPDWLSSLHNLVELSLDMCTGFHDLPQLSHLSKLKRLVLRQMYSLEYMENDICYDSSRPFFPSLQYLKISHLGIKGWWRPVGEEACSSYHDLWFPRLSCLIVEYCIYLTSLPLCPFVEDLTFEQVSVNLVRQLVRSCKAVNLEANSSSVVPTSSTLHTYTCSKLNVLSVKDIHDLAFLPDDFESLSSVRRLLISRCLGFKRSSLFSLLQNLPSLESLEFKDFYALEKIIDDFQHVGKDGEPWRALTRLKELVFDFGRDSLGGHLLKGIHHLTRLERLEINMKMSPNDEMQWTAPPNLKHLIIWDMDKVTIHQLKNLQTLEIARCGMDEHELNKLPWEDLKGLRKLFFNNVYKISSIPEKCQHLLALEDLRFYSCTYITFLPDWVSRLTSLEIVYCSKLRDKCRKPVGSYWPLIQDIPYFFIN